MELVIRGIILVKCWVVFCGVGCAWAVARRVHTFSHLTLDTWHQFSDFSCKICPALARPSLPCPSWARSRAPARARHEDAAGKTQPLERQSHFYHWPPSHKCSKNSVFQPQKKPKDFFTEKNKPEIGRKVAAKPSSWQIWGKWIYFIRFWQSWSRLGVNSGLFHMQLWHFSIYLFN